ncbi:MAG TPA: M48 family metallopeptidase [Actinomycetota bacterium]|jgi:STE24 endopeptidase|nr:M48 family metallopeptidase [Actinomycetota bacterium]
MIARRILLLALVLVIVAVWWASGLGRVPADPRRFFSEQEIARANDYQGPRYVAYAIGTILGLAVLAVLAFTSVGDLLLRPVRSWPRPLAATGAVVLTTVAVAVVRVPVSFWRGYVHERAWGFSTQTLAGWFSDWGKALGVSVVISALVLTGLVALIRFFPRAWPSLAVVAGAAVVVLLTYLAPVVLEPLFNRFEPLEDRELAAQLTELADRAGVPVREVLVADASRRTTKENAYVSGFGTTRRLVVYDTLLKKADRDEIVLVVAHELGHRREHHVEWATAIGAAATAAGVLLLWLLLRSDAVLGAARAAAPADPRIVPFVIFLVAALNLLTLPPSNWLSRRFERSADSFALQLTGDEDAYVRTERGLALRNLADLDPGPLTYRLLFTHPAPAERIALGAEVEPG